MTNSPNLEKLLKLFPWDLQPPSQTPSTPEFPSHGTTLLLASQRTFVQPLHHPLKSSLWLSPSEQAPRLDFPDKGKLTVFFPLEAKEDKKSRNNKGGHTRRSAFHKLWPLIITGFSETFGKFLLWNQCFTTASHSVWNLVPFNPKALAWTITTYQGNVINNDPELIAEALTCIKNATWHNTSIQNLVKWITQAQGCSGNPAELTVQMTQSWCLSYIETKNFNDDKGPVFILTGEPITDNLNMHRAIAMHICRLSIHVNYQQLINVNKIIGYDWCKNQDHPSHACPFLEVNSTWYGPSLEELRLHMMKTAVLKEVPHK
ncbi:hypothetical protein IW262DRAFT_1468881 [Armillaria fumosa]|nr:hypothetical protein IW262DRAFT_1468881 [Armillaria fumosa]